MIPLLAVVVLLDFNELLSLSAVDLLSPAADVVRDLLVLLLLLLLFVPEVCEVEENE